MDISLLQGGVLCTDDVDLEKSEHEPDLEEKLCQGKTRPTHICIAGGQMHTDEEGQ